MSSEPEPSTEANHQSVSLLEGGTEYLRGSTDRDLIHVLLEVERAWLMSLEQRGHAPVGLVEAAGPLWEANSWAVTELASGEGGNPVVSLTRLFRERLRERLKSDSQLSPDEATHFHENLTSQDVLDTALVLIHRRLLRDALDSTDRVLKDMRELIAQHRRTLMLARTLSQDAGVTVFGLKVATWYQHVSQAHDGLRHVLDTLPVSFGGPLGNLNTASSSWGNAESFNLISEWATQLGLNVPVAPWHVTRIPSHRVCTATQDLVSALGKVATDVVLLARNEIGELREGGEAGSSSSLAHKHNPIHAILIRKYALRAPQLSAQVQLAAALANDERPDGAWHSEWGPLLELLRSGRAAAELAKKMFGVLEVDVERMRENVERFEREQPGVVDRISDASAALIDRILGSGAKESGDE